MLKFTLDNLGLIFSGWKIDEAFLRGTRTPFSLTSPLATLTVEKEGKRTSVRLDLDKGALIDSLAGVEVDNDALHAKVKELTKQITNEIWNQVNSGK